MKGILEHKYVDASDDVAAYSADQCKRQAVTAEWAFEHLCDETLYVYREQGYGIDPWLTIDGGMDKLTKTEVYILCFGSTGELAVEPSFRVFASKRVVEAAAGATHA